MSLQVVTICVIGMAALAGILRVLPGWRRQRDQVRAWRPLLLLFLQLAIALLLYRTLFPPLLPPAVSASLTVLTEGATARDAAQARARGPVLALPEAPMITGVARIPDLGTALRQHPGVAHVAIAGYGLPARDRDAVDTVRVEAPSTPLPRGLQRLGLPARIAMGETLKLGGQVGGVAGARVELFDPANRRVDAARVDDDGGFIVSAPMLAAGLVTFELRVVEADGTVLETAQLPMSVEEASTPRVLLLGGAPNPETRAVQRWMQDAGFDVQARISLGAGMQLGNAMALTVEHLQQFDLLLVDARAWTDLGASGRATVLRAVDGGLGLLLRADTPMPSSAWMPLRASGFDIAGGASVEAFGLARPQAASGNGTGPTLDATNASTPPTGTQVPGLSRRNTRVTGSGAISLVHAVDGTPLGWWRAHGQGRLGVWTPVDTWRLPLLGLRDLHVTLWNSAVAPLLRATPGGPARFDTTIRAGERTSICGAGEGAFVQAPDDARSELLIDPAAASCAAFWPRTGGWHRLHDGERISPFFVHATDARPAERAADLRAATVQLAARPAVATGAGDLAVPRERGSPWPWFLAWLLVVALAWVLERARWGRLPAGH